LARFRTGISFGVRSRASRKGIPKQSLGTRDAVGLEAAGARAGIAAAALLIAWVAACAPAVLSAGERLDHYGDPLPDGAVLRLGTTRLRPGGFVRSLAFSRDGRVLVSAAMDGEIQLWEAATGRLIRSLSLSSRNDAQDVDFSADGTAIAVVFYNGWVQVRDAQSGKLRWERESAAPAHAVLFAPDGKTLATTADNGTVTLWDSATGSELLALHLTKYQWWQTPLAFSPDGNLLACGVQRDVRLFDLSSGEEVGSIKRAHGEEITRLAFSPDGKRLFSSGCRYERTGPQSVRGIGELRIFDVATRTRIRDLLGETGAQGECVFTLSADARTIVSRQANTLTVWDVASGKSTRTIPSFWLPLAAGPRHIDSNWGMSVKSFALSPDGKTFACAATPLNNVLLWDVASGHQKPAFPEAHSGPVNGLTCTADGSRIATCSADGTVRLWNGSDGRPQKTFVLSDNYPCNLFSVAFSRDGKTLVAAGRDRKADQDSGFVRIWDVESGNTRREVEAGDNVSKVAISHDGSKLLIERNTSVEVDVGGGLKQGRMRSQQPVVMLVDVRSGKKQPLIKLTSPLIFLAYSADGTTVDTIERNGSLSVWKSATGELVHACVVRDTPSRPDPLRPRRKWNFFGLSSAAVSSDGTLAVVGAMGGDGATMWDVTHEKQLGRLSPTEVYGPANCVAISPDARWIATASNWERGRLPIRIWEAKSGRLVKSFERPGSTSTMQFTPDSRRLITGMSDGSALVWEVPQ
jgi:WD40 repeat protein